eukprot:3108249-Pyramimonas_sp.AAC.1
MSDEKAEKIMKRMSCSMMISSRKLAKEARGMSTFCKLRGEGCSDAFLAGEETARRASRV